MLSAAEIVGALEHQTKEERLTVVPWPECQTAFKRDPRSASKRDPL